MDLATYLSDREISQAAFAETINVSPESVRRYVDGLRFPAPSILALIEEKTGLEVTASDFVAVFKARRRLSIGGDAA